MLVHRVASNWILSAGPVFSPRLCTIYFWTKSHWKISAPEFAELRYKVMKETEYFVSL
jgi:hypothetical protein